MMIVLRADCSLKEKAEITRILEAGEININVTETGGSTAFILMPTPDDDIVASLERHGGVAEVRRATPSCQLVTRDHRAEPTRFHVGHALVGPDTLTVIAGPCSVETRTQMMEIAECVADAGATMLRGGAFKPRTSPYSFQGLGERGLELLADAGGRFKLPTVTEVMAPEQAALIAQYADVLQVGARNMQNFSLLQAVGQQHRPILLKRSPMASIEELLCAAEYIAAAGNQRIMLCERGIRTFERATRSTLDISAVPVLKQLSHLPVIVDPSHAVGKREWVPPLAKCSVACGADGLMIEVHPNPEEAMSDGRQSLTMDQFSRMMVDVRRLAGAEGRQDHAEGSQQSVRA